jgi:hypothetical protein
MVVVSVGLSEAVAFDRVFDTFGVSLNPYIVPFVPLTTVLPPLSAFRHRSEMEPDADYQGQT